MNRQVAEEKLRQRFEASELSEHFEFLYRNWETHKGRRCGVRCKQCGETFETWAIFDYFKGVQPRMICARCGYSTDGNRKLASSSTWADEIIDFYIKGHTVRETADRFKLTTARVNSLVKERGVTNGRSWREGSEAENEKRSIEAEKRYAQTLDGLGFIYLGGYKNKKSSLEVQCKQCGHTFKRSIDYIKRERFECPECKRIREAPILEARRQEQERLKTQREEERNRQREEQKQRAEAENAEVLFHMMNDKNHVCIVCGKRFSKAEFMKDKGLTLIPTSPKYCSKECERKHRNKVGNSRPDRRKWRTGNHRHRARKYGVPYESGITLAKLIKRDGLRCALCGGMCNLNDHGWSEYSGATYPSIDHIIPMSKGGGHTWDNVQIAHMICNSLKSNKLEETG